MSRRNLGHPPFSTRPQGEAEMDYGSKDGANALSGQIRRAWLKTGFDVKPEVHRLAIGGAPAQARYVVHVPGLVNGLPTADVPRVAL